MKTKQLLKAIPKHDKKKKKEVEQEREKGLQELIKSHQQQLQDLEKQQPTTQQPTTQIVEEPKQPTPEEIEKQKREKKRERTRKRNEKKKQKEKERVKQVEREIKQSGISERERELAAIRQQLKQSGLTLKTIPSDGHCLYRAVADQLHSLKIGNIESDDYKTIRSIVADYMRKNPDDFIAFLETPNGELMDTSMLQLLIII